MTFVIRYRDEIVSSRERGFLTPNLETAANSFCEALECDEAFESKLSKFSVRHSVADPPLIHHGDALQDPSLGRRILSGHDSIAQFLGDRDEIEGGVGAKYGDAGDGHDFQDR